MSTRKQAPQLLIPGTGEMRAVAEKILKMLPSQFSFDQSLVAAMASDFADKYEELGYAYIHEVHDRAPSVSETKRQLQDVRSGAINLLDALQRTKRPASEALHQGLPKGDPALWEIQKLLERLIDASGMPVPPSAKNSRGPDRREVARRVALIAASDYFSITGREPTTTPPTKGAESEFGFLWLLREIFDALCMKDCSVTSNSRDAVEKWKEFQPRNLFRDEI